MNKSKKELLVKIVLLGFSAAMIFVFSACGIPEALNGQQAQNEVWLDAGEVSGPTLKMMTSKGEFVFDIEIADSPEQRAQGLMNRKTLNDNHGMLFIFDNEDEKKFWMKNTLIPLDMVFFNNDYRVVHVAKNAQPCKKDPCEVYPSVKPARYVLEIAGGLSDRLEVKEGDSAEVRL